jgi:hypothetical protein
LVTYSSDIPLKMSVTANFTSPAVNSSRGGYKKECVNAVLKKGR